MKMNIQIPVEIDLSDQQVRGIIQKFLRNKYNLKHDHEGKRWVDQNTLWEVRYDTRGNEINRTSKGASASEIAAQIILDEIS